MVCFVCHRHLSKPSSIWQGIGPVCARKIGYEGKNGAMVKQLEIEEFVKECSNINLTKMKHTLSGDGETREVYLDGNYLDPRPSQKHRNHSPDGFNWGYGGSGPAQLALAIMLKLTGKANGYQDFKFRVIAAIPMDEDFEITFKL